MINFVLHEHHQYAVVNFIGAWGRAIKPRIKVLTHQDLRFVTHLDRGTYVLGDLDRLTPEERLLTSNVADQLIAGGCRILNHPKQVVWRHELCRRLEVDGLNAYRCFRATEDWSKAQYPVFVRREDDHGSLKRELLQDADAVRREIAAGGDVNELLVIEYIDTREPDGLYRKYSAIRVGGRPFPRHLLFSRDWVVKYADLVDEKLHAEEERYLNHFGGCAKHEAQVARAFELAGVDYGRIDYSIGRDGRVQVWEINLSPNLGSPPNKIARERLPTQWDVSAKIVEAIGALDSKEPETPIAIRHDPALLTKLGVPKSTELLRLGGKLAHRLRRTPGLKWMCETVTHAKWLATQ